MSIQKSESSTYSKSRRSNRNTSGQSEFFHSRCWNFGGLKLRDSPETLLDAQSPVSPSVCNELPT